MNNIRPMNRTPRHIILTALLLLIGSAAMAQNDPQFVITNNGHYLEHVKVGGNWQLRNTDSFNPNCLWYSGNTVDVTGINHNYYFIDLADTSYHFLSAPLEPNGTLGLSASFPGAQLLRNVEQIYYFYNWDMESPGEGGGVARGLQYVGVNDSTSCAHCGNGGSWSAVDNQCWEVYWVEYKTVGTKWELSSASSYGITENSGRFRKVTVQEHLTPVENTGLINLKMNGVASTNFEISWGEEKSLSSTIFTPYRYTAYTSYVFGGSTHNYYNETPGGASSDHGSSMPTSTNGQATSVASYEWTLTGDGANYISFDPDDIHSSSNQETPTLYYTSPSNTGNEMTTLTLTVTYNDGSKQMLTATIKVKVECQNPGQEDNPIVTYDNVTVTWYNTADRYKIYWTKEEGVWNDANDSIVEGTNSYTFTDLDYNTAYWYKVAAFCNDIEMPNPTVFDFTTQSAPDLMIYGSVFGGGRMADVTGSPTIVIINCDTIGAVFGGNDIAGTVKGTDGSNIILGVDANDTYASAYNGNAASTKVRVNDVYGGGNGYYIYNGSAFESASEDTVYIADNAVVQDLMGNVVWTNQTGDVDTLAVPSIVKTAIKVTNNQVKIDSLFGGAKNAFLTYDDWHYNGDSIVIQGGTIFSVFGGNNVGGGQGKGKHYIRVTGTTTNLSENITNTPTTGYGRDFGIRYLFGGGNMVYGSTSDVHIEGGQLDTIFAGGNSADVYAANITVNCSLEAGTNNVFGHTYSNAFESDTYDGSDIHIKDDYEWDGFSGIYNVRTLFGGNNEASFDSKGNNAVPNITLTSGSVGTVYGGGNAGDMLAHKDGTITLDGDSPIEMEHSTKVIMNSPNMLVDYLYGGCQVSNVDYSTWVEIQDGHVGYVYGGCNVSGDVGSTRVNPHAPSSPPTLVYQAVQGSTYVKTTGGTVYKNLFAGGNGFYHCNDGINYIDSDIDYGDPEGYYIGLSIPTHNETHAIIGEGSLIKGNVYAGGNLAPVGFTDFTNVGKPFPAFVGLASVRVEDGTVEGDVYGGGNMAAIQGSNEVRVLGGTIGGALYGGNDRLGEMAQISNRVLPPEYDVASDGYTSLKDLGTRTYVAVSGRPHINTVYGGGNGAYDYSGTDHGGDMDYCNPDDQPIQGYTFVDIHINGSPDNEHSIPAGHINTVYGGGNGVSVTGSITVFINVQNPNDEEHVGTVFGGNNMGDLELVPDVILLHGNVGTVYGGCNQGAMVGRQNFTIEGATYNDVGSMVHLRKEYVAYNSATTHTVVPTAKVLNAVYGGCRMNGVQYVDPESHTANTNTLVYVGSGTHPASMFGGSDISGTISGTSHVVVTGGQTGNIYGGGNGNYYYNGNKVYNINDHSTPIDTIATGTITAPVSAVSQVDILGGQVGATGINNARNVFGGGLGATTSTTGNVDVIIGTDTASAVAYCPTIYGDIYGGSALGTVNTDNSDTTTVNILNGTVIGNIYGGGLGRKASTEPPVSAIEAKNFGKVYVNIGKSATYNCFLDLREANVFGCNNANGSPQDSVTVNIYQTAHSYTTYPDGVTSANYLADYSGNNPQYSIRQVFGGGNEADYAPETGTTSLTTVNVFTCDNTIGRVFGGGNAAAAHKVASYIYGGRFHQVFGGGNGTAEISANIGEGGASLNVYNGNILQLFGGNNRNGEITGPMHVNVTNDGTCNENIVEFFGGSNQAVMGSSNPVDLITNINCGAKPVNIHTVYGGSNMAAITGNVTLNIKGGEYTNVFGGSKGEGGTPANINGNVTLNLLGGSIQQAFGGSNINGNITGKITVNVLDTVASCGLQLDTVYGSGNLTAYTPDPAIASPEVNILKGIVNKVVFGGGKGTTAVVTANPKVTIGDNTHPAYITKVYGEVFGGGNAAPVNGNTTVICQANHATDTIYYLFGGGNEAGVNNNATVTMNSGVITQGIYGGCNTQGTVGGNINVDIYNGTLGTDSHPMTEGIYGGGKGSDTHTSGNITVTIGDGTTPAIYADVYGGSAFGQVGAAGRTAKVDLKAGTIHGSLYGGGKGDNTNTAEVTGDAELAIAGNVTNGVYGGCNVRGIVKEDVTVGVTGAAVIGDQSNTNRGIIYGGGLGLNTKVKGSVAVTINNASGHNYGDVYGGSAMGLVNCNEAGDGANPGSTTNVTLTSGTIHGNLYGGGHGLESHPADVYGNVTVTVNGGTVANVFGCNNLLGQPKNDVTVIISETTPSTMSVDSVFGGGNQAYYEGTPQVRISKGTVNHKVFGGGNNIANDNKGVGGSDILMSGGTVLVGIYGGCNTDGDVTGDVLVRLTGGTVGATNARANIHGGGYGQNTTVKGDVTVTFGDINAADAVYPMLYGDLYGGSALGTVNDEASDMTTVNIYSGTILGIGDSPDNYGNVFGGGLGNSTTPARVNGIIHVNIGSENGGQATLSRCSVYGCNNVNGSPQSDVYVDIYQTAHTEKDEVGYYEIDKKYALYQVFGGGNRAHYAPENGIQGSSKKTHVTIHDCENTVNYVYGGGNAADAVGVVTIIQGGRFNEVYGGGNGRVTAANIGLGGIGLNVVAGNVSFLFRGSNKNGENHGPDYYPAAVSTCLGGLFVDSYFFGTNEAELYYDLNHTITCAEAGNFEYRYVYAGSRWGIVYGDVSLTVCGGTIENLFGGCRGYSDYSADVRRFPTYAEIAADIAAHSDPKDRKYSQELLDYMRYPTGPEPSYVGHGGNINLVVNGGTIGRVFGGCDIRGNVEGKITITVNDAESTTCPLFIGEVYGGSNEWYYRPLNASINSPEVEIIRGTIGGIHTDLPVNNISGFAPTEYEGNVFGGGNFGNVTSNPVVIVGDGPSAKVTIKGNVFGGGNEGDVTGGPRVIVVPITHTLSITPATADNIVRVTNTVGEEISSGTSVGEGINLNLLAIPSTNYTFDHWSVTGNGTITNPNSASTSFTMGTGNCTIEAVFNTATTYVLNFSVDPAAGGTIEVKDAQNHILSTGASIGAGSVLTLSATPNISYKFKEWQVNDNPILYQANTTYTMAAATTTLKAVFEAVPTHPFTFSSSALGTVAVEDIHGNPVASGDYIGEDAVLSVTATPNANYALDKWTVSGGEIDNVVATEISFIMGKEDAATLSASFVPTHSISITDPENGTIKITNALGYIVNSGASIGEGAVLNLRAKPVAGYAFKEWQLTSGNGVIANPNAPITSLIMGTNDAVIKAIFVRAHTLTITPPENGTIKVTNILDQSVSSPASIGKGAVLNLEASPSEGHTFDHWEVTSGDGTITDTTNASTTFTMGDGDTTIRAIFN